MAANRDGGRSERDPVKDGTLSDLVRGEGTEESSRWFAASSVRAIVELVRLDDAAMAFAFRLLDRDRAAAVLEAFRSSHPRRVNRAAVASAAMPL